MQFHGMKLAIKPISLMIPLLLVAVLAGCGGGSDPTSAPTATPEATTAPAAPAGDAARGEQLYGASCIACHGPGGVGVQGLGKDMTDSEFIAGLSDAELVQFITEGRAPDDPLNTTGVLMPPKGGNPAMTEAQMYDIVAYIRSIHVD